LLAIIDQMTSLNSEACPFSPQAGSAAILSNAGRSAALTLSVAVCAMCAKRSADCVGGGDRMPLSFLGEAGPALVNDVVP
jgi:hypothetical protein